MKINDVLRHQIIKNLTARNAEKGADTATTLWERMAAQIISIVGEDGFNSLYERSIFLTQSTFPWFATSLHPPQADEPFAELKMSFKGKTPAQISEANTLLLVTFTDILASLIGEPLTTRLLCLAWDIDISNQHWQGAQK